MFDIVVFKEFIRNKVIWIPRQNKNDTTLEEWVDAVAQQEQPLHKFLNKATPYCTIQANKIFGITNKKSGLSINRFFLFEFGFKRCYKCKNILSVDNFYNNKSSWDKLTDECKICALDNTKLYNKNNKEHCNQYKKYHYIMNSDKYKLSAVTRRIKLLNALPSWITSEQLEQIEELYKEAKKLSDTTGIYHEVDHIIPLQGRYVSGLHIPENLQILSRQANRIKSNKYDTDIYYENG